MKKMQKKIKERTRKDIKQNIIKKLKKIATIVLNNIIEAISIMVLLEEKIKNLKVKNDNIKTFFLIENNNRKNIIEKLNFLKRYVKGTNDQKKLKELNVFLSQF